MTIPNIPFEREDLHKLAGSCFNSVFTESDRFYATSPQYQITSTMFVQATVTNPAGLPLDASNLNGCEFRFNVIKNSGNSVQGIVIGAHRDLKEHDGKEHFQYITDSRCFSLDGNLISSLTTGSTDLINQMYDKMKEFWIDYHGAGSKPII